MDVDKIIWCLKNGRSETKDALKKMLSSVNTIVDQEINVNPNSNDTEDENQGDSIESRFLNQRFINKSSGVSRKALQTIRNQNINEERMELPHSNKSHSLDRGGTKSRLNQRHINLNKSTLNKSPTATITSSQYENMHASLAKENDSTLFNWPHSNKSHSLDRGGTKSRLNQRHMNLNKSTLNKSPTATITSSQYENMHASLAKENDSTLFNWQDSNKIRSSFIDKKAGGTQSCLSQSIINLNNSTGGSRKASGTLSNHKINERKIDYTYQCDAYLNNNEAIKGGGSKLMMKEMNLESGFGDSVDQLPSIEDDSAGFEAVNDSDADSEAYWDAESESESDSETYWDAESDDESKPDKNVKYFQLFQMKSSTKKNLNFYDEKGYLYSRVNDKTENSFYFRCKNNTKFKCDARVIAKSNDLQKCVFTDVHTHLPEDHSVDDMKFKLELDKNCRSQPFEKGRDVYLNTKVQMNGKVNRNNIRGKNQYGTRIYRRHRECIPKLPSSPDDFEEFISKEEYNDMFTKDHRGLPFYRGVWADSKGDKNIVFISETILRFILTLTAIMLRMDGTFKVLPSHIRFRQLFIISVMFNDQSYPLAYIFMEKKDFSSYNLIMEKLKDLIPNNVTHIMADYESATRKAIRVHFPEARLCGCYFHFVQAIRKMAKRFGLKKDVKFTTAIRMLSALALLPSNFIAKGFEYIGRAFPKSQRWSRVTKYWKRQWKKANISVFNLVDRTNNFAESLNRSLNLLVKLRKPDIWTLIDKLKFLEMDYADQIDRADLGEMKTKKVNYKEGLVIALEEAMEQAMIKFEKDQDVGRFLKNVTYRQDPQNLLRDRVYLDDEITSESEDEEEDDDEIIPNYIQPETNFSTKNKKRKHDSMNSEMYVKPKPIKLKRFY